MRRRISKSALVVCSFAITMLWTGNAWTQTASEEKPPLYTYVSEWTVPRAMWPDYQKMEANDDAAMAKLTADGTIVSFGSYSVLNHQEGLPTHGSWFSARSMANLMKALEAERSTPDATGPILSAAKHWDYLFESRDYSSHSGTFKNGYLRVGNWKYKAGASDPDGKIMKATMVAMLEKLLADGALHSYQIDEESVHSRNPGTFFIAIVANGAEGIDKFNAAIEENGKKNVAGWAGFGSLLDSDGHRDFLAHVDTMTNK
jgi:hypothetical protein